MGLFGGAARGVIVAILCSISVAGAQTVAPLMLTQWRRLSCPLRITVDGHEACAGLTSPTLGYVTLALQPTPGKTVRIQLTGAPRPSDALELTEVAGKRSSDGEIRSPNARGSLAIVEAEFYGPRP